MKKAILVIDMPSCCYKCFALDDNGDYPVCILTGEQRGYNFRSRETKMDKCPLKPAPEEQERWYDDEKSDWERGYNNCVREIVGRKEDYE